MRFATLGPAKGPETKATVLNNKKENNEFYVATPIMEEKKFYEFVKRVFDIAIAIIAITVFVIPFAIISFAIKLDSPGPVIFKQERLGKNGKPFMMYKFRSMYIDAEKDGPCWAEKDDERCTKFGRFLRKTRLDELPQFWNILGGSMSFVGPRPEREYFYEEFEKYIFGFKNRLLVKPGLTGLAQVNGGYELLPEEKIVFDMEYIEKRSIAMDLKCILKTVSVVFTSEGAR